MGNLENKMDKMEDKMAENELCWTNKGSWKLGHELIIPYSALGHHSEGNLVDQNNMNLLYRLYGWDLEIPDKYT